MYKIHRTVHIFFQDMYGMPYTQILLVPIAFMKLLRDSTLIYADDGIKSHFSCFGRVKSN